MLASIALFLLFIVALLALPVDMVFTIQRDEESRQDIHFDWLFGLVKIPLTGRATRKQEGKSVTKGRNTNRRGGRKKVVALLRNPHFRKRFLTYTRYLMRSTRIKSLDLHVRIGLDDPADTGKLWGVLGPITALLASCRHAHIQIQPEFASESFTLHRHGTIRLIPIWTIMIGFCFFLSPAVIRAIASDR